MPRMLWGGGGDCHGIWGGRAAPRLTFLFFPPCCSMAADMLSARQSGRRSGRRVADSDKEGCYCQDANPGQVQCPRARRRPPGTAPSRRAPDPSSSSCVNEYSMLPPGPALRFVSSTVH